jgi:hypothetical protein
MIGFYKMGTISPFLLASFGLTDCFDLSYFDQWEVIGLIVTPSDQRSCSHPVKTVPFFHVGLPIKTLNALGLKGDSSCISLKGDGYVDVFEQEKVANEVSLDFSDPSVDLNTAYNSIRYLFVDGRYSPDGEDTFHEFRAKDAMKRLTAAHVCSVEQFLCLSQSGDFSKFVSKVYGYQIQDLRRLLLIRFPSTNVDLAAALNAWFTTWEKSVIKAICTDGYYTLTNEHLQLYDDLRKKIILHLAGGKVSVTPKQLSAFKRFFETVS